MKRRSPVHWHRWPAPVLSTCVVFAYGLIVLLSLRLTSRLDQAISVWLPDGIAIAVIVLSRRRIRPAIFVAVCAIHFAVGLIFGDHALAGALFTLADLCEIAVGVALILYASRGRRLLDGIAGVIRDVVPAALLAPLISSGIIALTLQSMGRGSFLDCWEPRYLAHVLGLLIMLPLCLAFTVDRFRQMIRRSVIPGVVAIAACLVVLVLLARYHIFPPVLFLNVTLVVSALMLPLLGSLFVNALVVVGSALFLQTGIVTEMPVFHSGFDPAKYLGLVLTLIPPTLVAVLLESLRNTEKRLIDATRRARASESAKAMFLAVMSHEIRSPLNSIIGFTNLLWDKEQDSQNRELIEPIRTGGEILLNLINDILDFSKFESGRLDLEEISFSPRDCIGQIEVLFAERAREKGLAFRVILDESVPPVLIGDVHRLRQVLINLVSNAVKFTTEGMVEVKLAVGAGGVESCRLEFSVRDTGIGIPAEQHDRIFERFSQIDSSMARRFGGTGLGLAISRSIARAMKGKLWFESTVGEGSVFYFQVSVRQPAVPLPEPAGERTPAQREELSAPAARLGVLVVDDNKINARLASLLLKRIGVLRTASVGDGRAAIEAVKSGVFDVVLMDCQMPVMDGFETSGRIRALEASGANARKVTIVALTAAVLPEDRKRALDAGMDDFLEKPVTQAALIDALERASASTQAG